MGNLDVFYVIFNTNELSKFERINGGINYV